MHLLDNLRKVNLQKQFKINLINFSYVTEKQYKLHTTKLLAHNTRLCSQAG